MGADNSNAMPRFKQLLRIIEILMILVFLMSATTRLPFSVKITGEYFRRLVSVVVCPLFIFLLGNLIVLTLFFKSRHLFPQHDHNNQNFQIFTETRFDYCQEFISNIDDESPHDQSSEKIVFQDKRTILEVTRPANKVDGTSSSCGMQLRRSETEKRRRRVADGGEGALGMVDELSNEEFKRAIEAFIARQIMFRHQEKNGYCDSLPYLNV